MVDELVTEFEIFCSSRPFWWVKFKVRRNLHLLRSLGRFFSLYSKAWIKASFELLIYPRGRKYSLMYPCVVSMWS